MFRIPVLVALMLSASPAWAHVPETQADRLIRIEYRCRLDGDHVVTCGPDVGLRRDTGYLRGLDAATLRLQRASSETELEIPTGSLRRLWVVDGDKSNFWTGAGIGLLAGAFIGGIIGATHQFCIFDCSPATAFGVVLGAPAGFVLGGVVGMGIRTKRWEEGSLLDLKTDRALPPGAVLSFTETL